jgi:hypothetical protein
MTARWFSARGALNALSHRASRRTHLNVADVTGASVVTQDTYRQTRRRGARRCPSEVCRGEINRSSDQTLC